MNSHSLDQKIGILCLARKLALGLRLFGMYLRPVRNEDYTTILQFIRTQFPYVPQLSTSQLHNWLSDAGQAQPLIVDVRRAEEYNVSHLRNAIHVTSVHAMEAIGVPKNRPVVVYCSIGFRSSSFAQKLSNAGFTNVMNLEGSIFAWANEHRPIYRGDQEVREVHPYSPKWGKFLDAKYHGGKP